MQLLADHIPLIPDLARICLHYYCASDLLLFEAIFVRTIWKLTRGKFGPPHPSPGLLMLEQIGRELPHHDPFVQYMESGRPENISFVTAMIPTKRPCCHRSACYYSLFGTCLCGEPLIPDPSLFSTYD